MQSMYLASAEGQPASLSVLAKKSKQLAERSVPSTLRGRLDGGLDLILAMSEDGRLSDASARDLLVELALRNGEVVAAIRGADRRPTRALSPLV